LFSEINFEGKFQKFGVGKFDSAIELGPLFRNAKSIKREEEHCWRENLFS
jgi:hypothetical protein